ncbi:hypothetical protein ANANG_G00096050 [Anguilla anguilla]|uniref:GB1/RHD3-type G domain-containing protein n=1 Tax=Anguilla anguilla TaxID=7936 RepID=A0A9D3MHP7_ANGAN|nr:hypothetical protein ANANG_G00096050 [Anguilla anguilla]
MSSTGGDLQVNQEALDILNSIEQTVVVVSIVGLYRTGKSYLMNRLARKQTGFPLGSTVQSETKGIWMWCVPHPHRDDQTLVLLDTEGLADVEKADEKNDTWIFSLVVLLSNVLVYNSRGTIDNDAVKNLHYVTELTEHIKVKASKAEETSSNYKYFFPTFVWAVRDFTLELEIDGKSITADEYLENALKLKDVLGNLAVTYVDAIRSGSVPCLENALNALSQIENSAAVEESFALYRRLLGERVKLHTETQEELSSAHEGCLKEALQLFMKRSFKDEDQKYQAALMERVKKAYEEKCAENEEMSRKHCAALLLQLEDDMDPEEAYMKPGGYQSFKDQLNNLVKLYRCKPAKGVKAEEVLEAYLREKNGIGKIILAADKNMSEQQRHLEEQRAQLEEEKQRAAAAREQQVALERRMNDIERAHKENKRQLMERMVILQAVLQAKNEADMEQKLRV